MFRFRIIPFFQQDIFQKTNAQLFGDFIVSDEGAKSGHAPCRGGNGIRIRVRDPGPRVRDPAPRGAWPRTLWCLTLHPVVPDPHVVPDPNMVRDPKKLYLWDFTRVRDPAPCGAWLSRRAWPPHGASPPHGAGPTHGAWPPHGAWPQKMCLWDFI